MTWTRSITGSVCAYISAVMLLLHSSPCISAHSNTQIKAPTIVKIAHKRLGTCHKLTCKVNPGGLKDETMVYWLADGDFIEATYQNITVTNKEKMAEDGTEYIHSTVVFRDPSQKIFSSNFTCVALSPAGFAKENIKIKRKCRGS